MIIGIIATSIVIAIAIGAAIMYFTGKFGKKDIVNTVMPSKIDSIETKLFGLNPVLVDYTYVNVDSGLKYLVSDTVIALPTDPLLIEKFGKIYIDGNLLEVFSLSNGYRLWHDAYEHTTYLTKRLAAETFLGADVPIQDDSITLDGKIYEDDSGLIQAGDILLRLYKREITGDSFEYLFAEFNRSNMMALHVGVKIDAAALSL